MQAKTQALQRQLAIHLRVLRSAPLVGLMPVTLLSLLLSGRCARVNYPAITFVSALLGLAPLAERLGYLTEVLAGYTNDAVSSRNIPRGDDRSNSLSDAQVTLSSA